MNLHIAGSILLASISLIGSTTTSNSVYPATNTPVVASIIENKTYIPVQTSELSFTEIKSLISHYSTLYNVSYNVMYSVIDCETGHTFNPKIQSLAYSHGVREDSWGLSQIHLPSWKGTITKDQALDPVFSIEFLAKNLSVGKGYLWSCYNILYPPDRN